MTTHGWLDLASLGEAVDRRAAMSGTPQLRRLLRVSAGGSLSAGEDLLHELLRAAGIVGWRANVRLRLGTVSAIVDVLFDQEKVAVEVDGWRSHSDRRAFQQDRTRQNALVAAGYVVLRFTWQDLTQRSAYVVRTVREALSGS